MQVIFDSKLNVTKNQQLARLVKAARKSLEALRSESAQWQGEGYQGDYSDDEIKELEAALEPFDLMYHD